jgi:hypothetical protein
MKGFVCNKCGMKINELCCGKCQKPLETKKEDIEGKEVCVCRCPSGCGQVKSPQCCGSDMTKNDKCC